MSDYTSTELRVSYGIGRQMAEQLLANPFDGIDIDAICAGLRDTLEGKGSAVSNNDLNAAFKEVNDKMKAAEAEKGKEAASAGEAFLAENAKKEGVVVTGSGLQYEVLVQGDGEKPVATSKVKTHYHGTLIDGTVFDSSVDRGQPAEFPVNGVIAGWTQALQLMPVGSKYRLYIPHNLAYGSRGAGASIAPYSALIFDVELLDIVG